MRLSGLRIQARVAVLLLSAAFLAGIAALIPDSAALAACVPAAGPGMPVFGTIVTCSGTTTDQNAPNGYGDGTQNGLTINVDAGAIVTATAVDTNGFSLGSNNTINNSGTIVVATSIIGQGIRAAGNLTVNNFAGATIRGGNVAIQDDSAFIPAVATVVNNEGSVLSPSNIAPAIRVSNLRLNNSGTVNGVVADRVDITNFGLIDGKPGPIPKTGNVIPIFVRSLGGSTVFNAGSIIAPATGAHAISLKGSGNTLTLAPTSIILGEVSGGNSDNTFQLGGTGSGSFNASQIGDTVISQYRGFSIFNKIDDSVWTLSGLGTQNWTITGGRLIGDTDSLQGPAITNNAALAFNQDFDGIYRGHIAGTGSLTKNGTGTLIVSDENSYSGGTVINAGTLQLGNGGGAGSIIGNVVNNATLAFNRSDVVTFGGVISGGGAVLHNGSGSTILTAVSTYTGATTVNAGILRVDGSVASSNVIVNGGGTLGGTGTVGNVTVNSGATLAPGNSIGTLRINGNLMLGADAIYRVELSPTAADLADVTGTATLGGTAQLVFGPGSYVARSYTVLSAAGGRSGVFGAVTTESLPATLSATVSYTATDVQVTLTSQLAPTPGSPTSPGPPTAPGSPTSPASPGSPAAPTPSLTLNQFAVATAQDIAFNSGQPSVTALFFVPLAQLPTALDQLSGEAHPTTMGVLVDEALYARSAVLGRLRQASYRGNSSMASLALGGPQTSFGDRASESAPADAKSPIVTKAPMRAPEASRDIVFWALGFGGWGRFNGDGNAASVQRDLAGFITGLDAGVGEAGRAGIAAGYTGSRAALHGRGSVSVETGHAAAYGGWSFGALNLRAGGIYAFHSIDTDRTIAFAGFFDRAFARYDGRSGQVFGEAGYGIAFAGIAIEPFAGGAWVRLDTDAAAERGGAAALNVAAGRFEVGYSTFGVRAAGVAPVGDGVMLIPRASLAWQHAFGSVTPEGRLVLANSGVPFAVSGVPIARDSLLAEAGLDLTIGRNATLGASYTGQLARNVHDHAAKGKFSWRF